LWNNEISTLLKTKYPIIQAPMAGGITSSKLVAAVSNAGGLGMIGAGYMNPFQIRNQIREIRELTSNHFGINLFIPSRVETTEDEIITSITLLQPYREQLSIQSSNQIKADDFFKVFNEQVQIVIEEQVPVCSFTFGIPPIEVVDKLKRANITLIGTATNVKEAMINEESGMDAIVVQGSEAGGHRGTFTPEIDGSLIGLMSLIPQVADQIKTPLIAAGGIMDGRGLMAAICLGAKGVQMGTAFLSCSESSAHSLHKQAILEATDDQTAITSAFSGKLARGIKNKFITEMEEHKALFPDYPIQNGLTSDIRLAAAQQNRPEFMSLWSGQSPMLARSQSVKELMNHIVSQSEKILKP
jgi:nitronate monooxygenase